MFYTTKSKIQHYKRIKLLQKNKGLDIYAHVIMSSPIHLLCKATNRFILSDLIGNFKKFTSKKILQACIEEPESRREWMLNYFSSARNYAGLENDLEVILLDLF